MIYAALVINNDTFYTTGTIRVRIQNYYYGEMEWDLSKKTSAITDGYDPNTKFHKDFDAYVFSTIGGGKNYGVFYLPEPNTKGFVAFTGNAIERGNNCFWMGSIFEPTFQSSAGKKTLDSINIPSDKITANGVGQDGFVKGAINSEHNKIDDYNGSLVIRLKSTKVESDTGSSNPKADNLNWDKSNTENLIVINKDKVLIHHPSAYDSSQKELTFQEINISPTSTTITLSMKETSSSEAKVAQLKLVNDGTFGFDLSMNDPKTKTISNVSSIDGILTINNKIDKNECSLYQDKNRMYISYNDAMIQLDKDISLSSKDGKIYVTGKEIRIGNGNQRMLTTTSGAKAYNFDNGLIINASENIFG